MNMKTISNPVLVALQHDVEQTLEEMVRECMRAAGYGALALGLQQLHQRVACADLLGSIER